LHIYSYVLKNISLDIGTTHSNKCVPCVQSPEYSQRNMSLLTKGPHEGSLSVEDTGGERGRRDIWEPCQSRRCSRHKNLAPKRLP